VPNLKVFVDERLMRDRGASAAGLADALFAALVSEMRADPRHCHVMLVPSVASGRNAPVYLDLSFRPNPTRTREAVEEAGRRLCDLAARALDAPCRLRARPQPPETWVSVDLAVEDAARA
jgi:hypothetical protein